MSQRRRHVSFLKCLAVFSAVACAGCGATPAAARTTAPTATLAATSGVHHVVIGDYAIGYSGLSDMKAGSKLVALGTVTAVQPTSYGSLLPATPARAFTFTLERVYKGTPSGDGRAVTVEQVGGPDQDGVNVENTTDPALSVGARAVLFLFGGDAYYTLINGGMSQFILSDGRVHQVQPFPPSQGVAQASQGAYVDGESEAAFLAQVEAA